MQDAMHPEDVRHAADVAAVVDNGGYLYCRACAVEFGIHGRPMDIGNGALEGEFCEGCHATWDSDTKAFA
jgi:hypothetical protein